MDLQSRDAAGAPLMIVAAKWASRQAQGKGLPTPSTPKDINDSQRAPLTRLAFVVVSLWRRAARSSARRGRCCTASRRHV